MKQPVRERDLGLQPERTMLAWQRTVFSLLILALVIIRTGYLQQDLLLCGIGGGTVILAATLIIMSRNRQKTIDCDPELTSHPAVMAKFLFCSALCLNALAIALHSFINLLAG